MTKIDSRFRQQCSKLKFQMDDMEVLGWSLFPFQKQLAGTWLQRPGVISVMNAALFAGQSAANMRLPPCKLGKKRIEVLHLSRWDTHTPSFTHNFVTHTHHLSLSHTIFHIQLCHTHNFVLLLDPPPPLLSFLPSPSPLQHLVTVLIIGRSCLVGLSKVWNGSKAKLWKS